DKGIFLLVRTSNPDAAELQDSKNGEGETLSERVARFIRENESSLLGECGISALGAVVGATRPEEAKALRKLMPKSLFLVPGFGAQGGGAADALAGAISGSGVSKRGVIINSSRGIFALEDMNSLSKEEFQSQIAKRAEEQKIALAK
ncbi:MAG: orotidine 5'-phosphate decarboxylase, partial [Bdellovibrionales bacterium]|nr:orotidine 5'-phosphate decarboxylase [Bdellovibrionales bacterium]